MTTRTRTVILLLALAIATFTLLACDWSGDGEAWREWQEDVNSRQRQPGQPGTAETPSVERTER